MGKRDRRNSQPNDSGGRAKRQAPPMRQEEATGETIVKACPCGYVIKNWNPWNEAKHVGTDEHKRKMVLLEITYYIVDDLQELEKMIKKGVACKDAEARVVELKNE
eukprot:GHVU01220483.1.p2 GENE.GHVU01220483.1~~GHVU01220483.1.p2  ORF type:complete len:106 (+),score=15.23 GHVU01220483.1:116-433(+)